MERALYSGLPNCFRLTNGVVEMIVATDIGPRILHYGFVGGENILGAATEVSQRTQLGEWKAWGGHRLWVAPESVPDSYAPDNSSIEHTIEGERSIRLRQPLDAAGFEKEVTVHLSDDGTGVELVHRLTNHTQSTREVAPWALTIMRGGGEAILPQEPFRPHQEALLPARSMSLWHYTDLTDPRWTIGGRLIRLRTDARQPAPQKLGIMNKQGWAAYHLGRILFIKRFAYEEHAIYPDYGSNNEVYTAGSFIELETLAPLTQLADGMSAQHVEHWSLLPDIQPDDSEQSIIASLQAAPALSAKL